MILHLVIDDKFMDKGLSSFEAGCPDGNRLMAISKKVKFDYLKTKPDRTIKPRELLRWENIKYIRSFDAIVLHTLDAMGSLVSIISRKSTKILWIGWGYDYYGLFQKKGYCIYGEKTRMLLDSMEIKKRISLRTRYTNLIFNIIKRVSLKRIDYFSPVTREDYLLFKKYFLSARAEYLPWNYGKLAQPSSVYAVQELGKNILLGNSASFSNNHLEAFDILSKLDLQGRKIIAPLSYGDDKYADEISRIGKKMFGDSFIPVREYLEGTRYIELLKTCSIVVMNHKRQQAAGNLNTMIELGAMVFLDTINPLFNTYKNLDVKVFSTDDLLSFKILGLNVGLSPEQKEKNWKNLRSWFSEENIKARTKDIIKRLS